MAFFLGVRHGFDLDHLATIDSLTRTVSYHRLLSKLTGFLFSLGHGLVVISISLVIGAGLMPGSIPPWLNGFGEAVSITFLLLFGLLTLWNVFRQPEQSALPTSLKNYVSKRLAHKTFNPVFIVLIGMLFAFSFDTFSQVALFSISATALSGCMFAGVLGVFFMLGMMTSDGLNGLFVSTIIQRANRRSLLFSRFTGLMIASFSLILGTVNGIKLL